MDWNSATNFFAGQAKYHIIVGQALNQVRGSLAKHHPTTVGQGFSLAKRNTYKKRPRLKNFNYRGPYRYFVTICTDNKRKIFIQEEPVKQIIDILRESSKLFGFRIWAYCFMPDHLHLLLEGTEDKSDFKKFISQFKQSTGFYFKRRHGYKL